MLADKVLGGESYYNELDKALHSTKVMESMLLAIDPLPVCKAISDLIPYGAIGLDDLDDPDARKKNKKFKVFVERWIDR